MDHCSSTACSSTAVDALLLVLVPHRCTSLVSAHTHNSKQEQHERLASAAAQGFCTQEAFAGSQQNRCMSIDKCLPSDTGGITAGQQCGTDSTVAKRLRCRQAAHLVCRPSAGGARRPGWPAAASSFCCWSSSVRRRRPESIGSGGASFHGAATTLRKGVYHRVTLLSAHRAGKRAAGADGLSNPRSAERKAARLFTSRNASAQFITTRLVVGCLQQTTR